MHEAWFITGAASGLGFELTHLLLARGRRNVDACQATVMTHPALPTRRSRFVHPFTAMTPPL
jgi:NAD(P)-dependent dehydrogenase (short-subunit alcohol dehydrogenase family)